MILWGNGTKRELVDDYTVALLHFNESATRDECGNKWSIVGNPTISGDQSKFGGGSLQLNGADYLSAPINKSLNLATGDFTIDWWEYRAAAKNYASAIAFDDGASGQYDLIAGYMLDTGKIVAYASSTNSSWDILNSFNMGSVQVNKWVHRALARQGSSFYSFENGKLIGTATSSGTINFTNIKNVIIGNRLSPDDNSFVGYIEEVRISKSIARWTTDFTVPTRQYEYIGLQGKIVCENDLLANVRFDDTGWLDKADNANQWTGTSVTYTGSGKFGGRAVGFSGTRDQNFKLSKNLLYGLNEFTISIWSKFTQPSGNTYDFVPISFANTYTSGANNTLMMSNRNTSSMSSNNLTMMYNCTVGSNDSNSANIRTLSKQYSTADYASNVLNKYVHLAMTYKNNTAYYFVNGELVSTTPGDIVSNGITKSTSAFTTIGGSDWVGNTGGDYTGYGNVDDLVVVRNKALWTENFVPPDTYLTDKTLIGLVATGPRATVTGRLTCTSSHAIVTSYVSQSNRTRSSLPIPVDKPTYYEVTLTGCSATNYDNIAAGLLSSDGTYAALSVACNPKVWGGTTIAIREYLYTDGAYSLYYSKDIANSSIAPLTGTIGILSNPETNTYAMYWNGKLVETTSLLQASIKDGNLYACATNGTSYASTMTFSVNFGETPFKLESLPEGTVSMHAYYNGAAQVGDCLAEPEDGWTRYDDTDTKFEYKGIPASYWTTASNTPTWWSGNTVHFVGPHSSGKNAYVRFFVKASSIRFINMKHLPPKPDKYDVYIDSVYHSSYSTSVDIESEAKLKILVHQIDGLDPTKVCMVEVRVNNSTTGYQFCWDAIDLPESGELVSPQAKILLEVASDYDSLTQAEKIALLEDAPYTDLNGVMPTDKDYKLITYSPYKVAPKIELKTIPYDIVLKPSELISLTPYYPLRSLAVGYTGTLLPLCLITPNGTNYYRYNADGAEFEEVGTDSDVDLLVPLCNTPAEIAAIPSASLASLVGETNAIGFAFILQTNLAKAVTQLTGVTMTLAVPTDAVKPGSPLEFNFVFVGYSPAGDYKLVADRNIQTNITWETLNASSLCTSSGLDVTSPTTKEYGLKLRLPQSSTDGSDCEWNGILANGPVEPSNDVFWRTSIGSGSWTLDTASNAAANRVVRGTKSMLDITSVASTSTSGYRPIMLVSEKLPESSAPKCTLEKRKSPSFVKPGQVLSCEYKVATANTVGVFSNLGCATLPDIEANPGSTPSGTFYFICVGYAPSGDLKFIADRNIQGSVSWETLNAGGYCTSSGTDTTSLTGGSKSYMRLIQSSYVHPDCDINSSEWDMVIKQPTIGATNLPGYSATWNYSKTKSWMLNTPGHTDIMGTPATADSRVVRGCEVDSKDTQTMYIFPSTFTAGSVGFRPIMLVSDVEYQNCYLDTKIYHTNSFGSKSAATVIEPQESGLSLVSAEGYYTIDGINPDSNKHLDIWNYSTPISYDYIKPGDHTLEVFAKIDGVVNHKKFPIKRETHLDKSLVRRFRSYDAGYTYDSDLLSVNGSLKPTDKLSGNAVLIIEGPTEFNVSHRTGINSLVINGSNVKVAVSTDGGITYQAWDNTGLSWVEVPITDVWTSGTDIATTSAITSAQWSGVFTKTSLKVALALGKDSSVNSVTLNLPPNSPPTIVSTTVIPRIAPSTDTDLNIVVDDPEKDKVQYQISINDKLYSDWSELIATPYDVTETIQKESLKDYPSSNKITVVVRDEIGNTTSASTTITMLNSAPVISVQTSNNREIKATIVDPDGDNISYTLYVKDKSGKRIAGYTKYEQPTPVLIEYFPQDLLLTPGEKYSYVIECTDNTGLPNSTAQVEVQFTALPYGLLWYDSTTGELFVDECGNVVNILFMEHMYRGAWTNDIFSADVYNYTDYDITNLEIQSYVELAKVVGHSNPKSADYDISKHAFVYLDDTGNFNNGTNTKLSFGANVLKKGDHVRVWMQGYNDMDSKEAMLEVKIMAKGTAIR